MAQRIVGLEGLLRKYGRLAQVVASENMNQAVGKAASRIQAEAKLLCPVNDGELRQSIRTSVRTEGDKTTGAIYTNKKHGAYVEFGTGPKGEADHAGISPLVSPAYSQSPWWIHESQIDKETAEKYHMFSIETADGVFYQTSGQAAQPFLYPALKNNEDRVTREVKDYLARKIREVCEP